MNRWKKIGIALLIILLVLKRRQIHNFFEECRIRDLFIDAFDHLWTLPQGLRFALVSAFFILIMIMTFRYLMKQKGGDDK